MAYSYKADDGSEYINFPSRSITSAFSKEPIRPSAAFIRGKYGLADPYSNEFAPDVAELEKGAKFGLGNLTRQTIAAQSTSMARNITDQFAEIGSSSEYGYGGIISSGLMNRYKALEASSKIAGFGEIVHKAFSADESFREQSRSALFNFLVNRSAADSALVMQELQMRAQLKKD